jgi:hypothetical protein
VSPKLTHGRSVMSNEQRFHRSVNGRTSEIFLEHQNYVLMSVCWLYGPTTHKKGEVTIKAERWKEAEIVFSFSFISLL